MVLTKDYSRVVKTLITQGGAQLNGMSTFRYGDELRLVTCKNSSSVQST